MSKYGVTCTIIYNGYVEVEANDWEDACDKVEGQLNWENLSALPNDVKVGDVRFTFGEATADYGDKIED